MYVVNSMLLRSHQDFHLYATGGQITCCSFRVSALNAASKCQRLTLHSFVWRQSHAASPTTSVRTPLLPMDHIPGTRMYTQQASAAHGKQQSNPLSFAVPIGPEWYRVVRATPIDVPQMSQTHPPGG